MLGAIRLTEAVSYLLQATGQFGIAKKMGAQKERRLIPTT
jgi:hypothetical protein